jgi:NTE family protein
MLAVVLSGGGNRGPLEVGALQVLLEHGIVPDMLVGTSAGAINAAFLAIDPTPHTAYELGQLWTKAGQRGVFRGNRLSLFWRLMTGKDSLYRNEDFRRLIEDSLPPDARCFSDIEAVKLVIVATRLDTGEPRVFGHDPHERLLDAIMASTALPPFFPPWSAGDELLIDGGIAADLPVSIAIAEGATEIYALHLVDAPPEGQQMRGLLSIAEQAINTVLFRQLQIDLKESEHTKGVTLHYVPLTGFYGLPLSDLSRTAEMIQGGRQQMEEYLHASAGVAKGKRSSRLRAALRRVAQRIRRSASWLPMSRWIPGRFHRDQIMGNGESYG